MFKLKHLIAMASLAYIVVISVGVVGFRYMVSLPELNRTTDIVYQYDIQHTSDRLLELEGQLLKQLSQSNFSHSSNSKSGDQLSLMFRGSLTNLEKRLEQASKAPPFFPEIIDEFMILARDPSNSRVSYVAVEEQLYQLGILKSESYFKLTIRPVNHDWLGIVSQDLSAHISVAFNQSNPLNSYIPLMDAQGYITAYVCIEHSLDRPKLIDMQTGIGLLSLLTLPILITVLVIVVFVMPMINMINSIKTMNLNSDHIEIEDAQYIFELKAFAQAFNELLFNQARQQELLKHETLTDQLTGIPNRRAFDQALDHDWRFAMRAETALTVIIADIDHFKNYNDEYGHQEGDKALAAVALALRSCCRRANEFVARYGGEEFGMILQADSNPERFLSAANQAVRRLNIEHCHSSCSDILTISIGACTLDPHQLNHPLTTNHIEQMLKQADDALYESKESGRNRFNHVIFDAAKK